MHYLVLLTYSNFQFLFDFQIGLHGTTKRLRGTFIFVLISRIKDIDLLRL